MLSCVSHVQLCATPWPVAPQAPLSMELSRQEYWSGLPFPSPGVVVNKLHELVNTFFQNRLCGRWFCPTIGSCEGFPGGSVIKNTSVNAGDSGLIPGSGRSHGGGHGNPLQYSCLENPMDTGACWATVYGVAKQLDMTERLNNNKEHQGSCKRSEHVKVDWAKLGCLVR